MKNNKEWFIIDCTKIRLGKLAVKVAQILQGKHKAGYVPNKDTGDYVILINSKKIDIFPTKYMNKFYYRHSGYAKGFKKIRLKELSQQRPNEVIKRAVKGMMPKSILGQEMLKKLFIYSDNNHKHEAQKPRLFEVK